jgi:hypothetical protein
MSPIRLTKALLEKYSISMEVFIPIVVIVFWFWATYAGIQYGMNKLRDWQNQILVAMAKMEKTNDDQMLQMKENLKTASHDHKVIENRFAYVLPTMRLLSQKFWLPVYEGE